jgi:hypothetical protein
MFLISLERRFFDSDLFGQRTGEGGSLVLSSSSGSLKIERTAQHFSIIGLRLVFSNSFVVLVVSLVVVVVVVVFSSSYCPERCLGAETGRTIVHLLLSSPSSASFFLC